MFRIEGQGVHRMNDLLGPILRPMALEGIARADVFLRINVLECNTALHRTRCVCSLVRTDLDRSELVLQGALSYVDGLIHVPYVVDVDVPIRASHHDLVVAGVHAENLGAHRHVLYRALRLSGVPSTQGAIPAAGEDLHGGLVELHTADGSIVMADHKFLPRLEVARHKPGVQADRQESGGVLNEGAIQDSLVVLFHPHEPVAGSVV
mmetsp:Transcript_47874/g.137349  ORF Transcript_47874/g.137349 Transcript_47874/m.137349 type:complete len:207 (+) Transcript_47874:314-934(+)